MHGAWSSLPWSGDGHPPGHIEQSTRSRHILGNPVAGNGPLATCLGAGIHPSYTGPHNPRPASNAAQHIPDHSTINGSSRFAHASRSRTNGLSGNLVTTGINKTLRYGQGSKMWRDTLAFWLELDKAYANIGLHPRFRTAQQVLDEHWWCSSTIAGLTTYNLDKLRIRALWVRHVARLLKTYIRQDGVGLVITVTSLEHHLLGYAWNETTQAVKSLRELLPGGLLMAMSEAGAILSAIRGRVLMLKEHLLWEEVWMEEPEWLVTNHPIGPVEGRDIASIFSSYDVHQPISFRILHGGQRSSSFANRVQFIPRPLKRNLRQYEEDELPKYAPHLVINNNFHCTDTDENAHDYTGSIIKHSEGIGSAHSPILIPSDNDIIESDTHGQPDQTSFHEPGEKGKSNAALIAHQAAEDIMKMPEMRTYTRVLDLLQRLRDTIDEITMPRAKIDKAAAPADDTAESAYSSDESKAVVSSCITASLIDHGPTVSAEENSGNNATHKLPKSSAVALRVESISEGLTRTTKVTVKHMLE